MPRYFSDPRSAIYTVQASWPPGSHPFGPEVVYRLTPAEHTEHTEHTDHTDHTEHTEHTEHTTVRWGHPDYAILSDADRRSALELDPTLAPTPIE